MVRSLYTSANMKINVTVSFELADFGNLRVTLEYFFKANQTVKSLYTSANMEKDISITFDPVFPKSLTFLRLKIPKGGGGGVSSS